jgi:predicted nuclease of restriction endonuclease-like (RecB) superfamily
MPNSDIVYVRSTDLLHDAQQIIESARSVAYHAVNVSMVQRNWLLGKRIAEEELQGQERAKYGAEVIKKLSRELTNIYGKGFDFSTLYKFTRFYRLFPEILDSVSPKSAPLLTWMHYRVILQVDNDEARRWCANEAAQETWGVRTLQRNISSQYYSRLLKFQHKDLVRNEMIQLTSPSQQDKLKFIKNPVVAEFLGLSPNSDFTESDYHIQPTKVPVELGKGFAFVARKQHIRTEKQDYYIDLVFYNYFLKCFVLLDLKTTKITHQDVDKWICISACTTS